MKTHYCLFVLFFFIIGCDGPLVTFKSPQPADVKNQDHFPKQMIGKYLSLQDSSIITISDKTISRGFNIQYVVSKKELDTMKYCTVKNDTLYNGRTNEKTCVVLINDTLYTPYDLQDTLFRISDKNILRKDKGYYFLNILHKSGWEVQKLEFRKGRLNLCSISDMEEVESLKQLTAEPTDSFTQISLDKKQFQKFIKSKGFMNKEAFVKLR